MRLLTRMTQGFTLVELITVIVVLGVLATFALPRFLNINAEARYAKLKSVAGAVESAGILVYQKATIVGQTGATGQVTLSDGTVVDLAYGYPAATSTGIARVINMAGMSGYGVAMGDGTKRWEIMVVDEPWAINRCYFDYIEASASSPVPRSAVIADSDPLASKGGAGVSQCAD